MAMHQGLFLVQDLKLAHYLKIPPRAMFFCQLSATLLALLMNIFTSFFIYESFGRSNKELINPDNPSLGYVWLLQSSDTPKGWNANSYTVFINAGAVSLTYF
jgi:hypothetical protein